MTEFTGSDDDDYLKGTDRRDRIVGLAGYDVLYGLAGDDRLDGGADGDLFYGGTGNDVLIGGEGFDVLRGEDGDDRAIGGPDDDYLYGSLGNDLLDGGPGNDAVFGDLGDDDLRGGDGDDGLRGGAGLDLFDGGAGFDFANVGGYQAVEGAVIDLRTGIVENDGFDNRETLLSIEGVAGTQLADVLIGNNSSNTIAAYGADIVKALGGDDRVGASAAGGARLDGGKGVDTLALYGSKTIVDASGALSSVRGDQAIVVSLADDRVANDGFGGSFRIKNFENVSGGPLDDRIRGDAGDNVLYGGDGNDVLVGGGGADTLVGGNGFDSLRGGAGNDVFAFGTFLEQLYGEAPYTDVIEDFSPGDKLQITPDRVRLPFHGTQDAGGALAIFYEIRDGNTLVYVRSHLPSAHIDFTITMLGEHSLTADDFIDLRDALSAMRDVGADAFPVLSAAETIWP